MDTVINNEEPTLQDMLVRKKIEDLGKKNTVTKNKKTKINKGTLDKYINEGNIVDLDNNNIMDMLKTDIIIDAKEEEKKNLEKANMKVNIDEINTLDGDELEKIIDESLYGQGIVEELKGIKDAIKSGCNVRYTNQPNIIQSSQMNQSSDFPLPPPPPPPPKLTSEQKKSQNVAANVASIIASSDIFAKRKQKAEDELKAQEEQFLLDKIRREEILVLAEKERKDREDREKKEREERIERRRLLEASKQGSGLFGGQYYYDPYYSHFINGRYVR